MVVGIVASVSPADFDLSLGPIAQICQWALWALVRRWAWQAWMCQRVPWLLCQWPRGFGCASGLVGVDEPSQALVGLATLVPRILVAFMPWILVCPSGSRIVATDLLVEER